MGEGARFFDGYEGLFLPRLEECASRAGDSNDFASMSLRGCVSFFRARLGMQEGYPGDERVSLIGPIQQALSECAYERICGNPACGSRRAGEEPIARERKLQACGRCKVVHYCGRECQRQDWTQGIPHKSICPILSRLVAQLGPHSVADFDNFNTAFAACGVSSDDEVLLIRWALALGHVPISVGEMAYHLRRLS
ncbi:hypothetical protein AURDEDRAFT_116925 [Auricularia subglabra TFB-10046 SS5]|nr:hypothetical protein AURDEDRAFT_116925 [Auricularia subglabra TFB-10046 SS5]